MDHNAKHFLLMVFGGILLSGVYLEVFTRFIGPFLAATFPWIEVASLDFGRFNPIENSHEAVALAIECIIIFVYFFWYLVIWHPFEQVYEPEADGETN